MVSESSGYSGRMRFSLRAGCAVLVVVISAVCSPSSADIQIDPDNFGPAFPAVQNETSLVVNPGTPGNVVVAYNDNPSAASPFGLGISYSTDGGANWTATQLTQPTNGISGSTMTLVFDPTITADTQGNVYAGYIGWDSATYSLTHSGMYVQKSTNGGANWSAAVEVAVDAPAQANPDSQFRLNDRCQITADTYAASQYTDRVYLTWMKDRGYNMPTPDGDIYFSYSSDNGATFSTPVQINQTIHNLANMPIPTVASDGAMYIAWMDYDVTTGGSGTIYLDKSTNGGVTWQATDTFVKTINLPPLHVTTGGAVPVAPDARAKGAAVISASPTAAQDLYIVYAADPKDGSGDEADIFLIKSTNSGGTWGGPVKVNHDDITPNDNIEPWITVKSNGDIDVAWYDRRDDPADAAWHVYAARSTDGGATFTANVRISDTSFLTPMSASSDRWMGEYLGLDDDGTNAYIAWTSSVTDLALGDVYFDKIANSEIPEPATLFVMTAAGLPLLLKRKRTSRACLGAV